MKLTNSLIVLSLFISAPAALAVPAQRGVTERHQPDGTIVRVQLVGDEFQHYMLSEDGYPLTEQGGTLYFSTLAADGSIVASRHKAANRTAETERWLSTLDKESLVGRVASRPVMLKAAAGPRRNPGLHASSFPHKGEPRALVVLVEYQDVKCNTDNPGEYFSGLLSERGFKAWGATGSALDYFIDNSAGQFAPQFDMVGPVTLPETMAYYGANGGPYGDAHAEDMVIHACRIIDDQVDFSQYDHDGDGLIDNVFIFFAGRGENAGGSDDTVWPHSWDVRAPYPETPFIFDGVQLGHYACTNEWKDDRPDGIGTFIHEFSHVLGLPDLYVTSGGQQSAFTPGAYNVMDYGPYNNKSRTPAGYSLYERYALEWVEPIVLDHPDNITLQALGETNQGYILHGDSKDEFFLFENRQQRGWDAYIPGHGMLVWHVDYDAEVWENGGVNNVASHQRVDLIEADANPSTTTRAGDAFPGTAGVTDLSFATRPQLASWSGRDLETPLSEIAESKKGVITFKVKGGLPDSEVPEVAEASEVGSYAFTISWGAVTDAEEYIVEVSRQGEGEPFLTEYLAPEVTSFRVENIAPETVYLFTVSSRQSGHGVSPRSPEKSVTTGLTTFEWYAPTAIAPIHIADKELTAAWLPMDGAVEYFVTLFDKQEIVTTDETFDFSGGRDCLPTDWICTSEAVFEQGSNSGESAPSLRMNSSGAIIESALFESDVCAVSFWHRGVNNAEGNEITVSALVEGEWVPVGVVIVTEEAGGRIDIVDAFPIGSKAFRIEYKGQGTKRGPIALDDLTVSLEHSFSKAITGGYDNASAGADTMLRLTGLIPLTTYYYVVRAFDGSLYSRESKPVRVRTLEEGDNSITEVSLGTPVAIYYYSLDGCRVVRPAAGLYIKVTVYADGTRRACKTIVR